MTCGIAYNKLWNNYLNKYGDFRERLQTIKKDHECLALQYQLSNIKQKSINTRFRSSTASKNPKHDISHRKLFNKRSSHSSITKKNLSCKVNQIDVDELEQLIQAENFPENIFSENHRFRPSIEHEIDLTVKNNVHDNSHLLQSRQLLEPLKSSFSKNSMLKTNKQSSANLFSNSHKSIQVASSSADLIGNRHKNLYVQLLEHLRQGEKSKLSKFDTKLGRKSSDINANTNNSIQKLLSFLRTLDSTSDDQQNSSKFDESTLLDLFSVDHHLSSSTYVPINIHQLHRIPKTIRNSLKRTSDGEQMLGKIQADISSSTKPGSNSKGFKNSKTLFNFNKPKVDSHEGADASAFDKQNNELVKLFIHDMTE
ncbi:unnamed protein product [Rotaria socialis]|uniref:Uncharacterized protein n=2 Tax=Rotaria socialis TaxID=392032 RepID=A0A820RUZ5_9BILA|nr:unnamed protein product [Rotaria socialis]CAF4445380.1 unnamed protein product [Rotaria socialis]CAF4503361.1 unnamed protein product [Rotaria socialis]